MADRSVGSVASLVSQLPCAALFFDLILWRLSDVSIYFYERCLLQIDDILLPGGVQLVAPALSVDAEPRLADGLSTAGDERLGPPQPAHLRSLRGSGAAVL